MLWVQPAAFWCVTHIISRKHVRGASIPRRASCREIAVDVHAAEGEAVVARLKSFDIDKSQTTGCSICPDADQKLRYRLLECSSETCVGAIPVKCAWRGKMVTCLDSEHVSVFEFG